MQRRTRPPRQPLEDALFLIGAAHEVLLRFLRGKSSLDEYDLASLQKIREKCDFVDILAYHGEVRQRQRLAGEPETPLPPECDRK